MAKPLTTDAELRAEFPTMARWMRLVLLALQERGSIDIGSRIERSGFEDAGRGNLFPNGARVPGRLKKAATIALEEAIKPYYAAKNARRRTGQPRRRAVTKRHIDEVIAASRLLDLFDAVAIANDLRVLLRRRALTTIGHRAFALDMQAQHGDPDALRRVVAHWLNLP